MRKWGWFLVSFGCLLVMISPTLDNQYPTMITGIALAAIGAYIGLRKEK